MDQLKWKGPVWRNHLILIIEVVALTIVMVILEIIVLGWDPLGRFGVFVFLLFALPSFYFIGYAVHKEVWHSTKTRIRKPITHVVPRVFNLLTDEGVPFTVIRTNYGNVSFFEIRWEEKVHLDYGGLRLYIRALRGDTHLYLGPVDQGNDREFARVKALIERVAREG